MDRKRSLFGVPTYRWKARVRNCMNTNYTRSGVWKCMHVNFCNLEWRKWEITEATPRAFNLSVLNACYLVSVSPDSKHLILRDLSADSRQLTKPFSCCFPAAHEIRVRFDKITCTVALEQLHRLLQPKMEVTYSSSYATTADWLHSSITRQTRRSFGSYCLATGDAT